MTQPASHNPLRNILGTLSGADQLRLEKARLEAFLAAYPGEYCGFSPDGSALYSAGFSDMLGIEAIENIHDIQNALTTSDAAVLEGMFFRLQDEQKKFSIDVETSDNKKILSISGSIGQSLNGQDIFLILWIEDVTDKNKKSKHIKNNLDDAEEKLKKFQTILDEINIPIWMRDENTNITWVNQTYCRLTGVDFNDVIKGQKEFTLTSKDKSKAKSPKHIARIAADEKAPQTTYGHMVSGGKRHYVEITESPLQNFEGNSNFTLGMAQDISREEELDTQMQRYVSANKTLMEQLRSAIAIYDSNQQLEFFNASFAELWGLEEQWLNGKPKLGDVLEKLRETRRLPEQADFRNYKKGWLDMFTRLIDPHEDMLYLPDGSALRMLIAPHPMGGLMMTFEDVTSRLELESSYNTLIAVQKETLDNLAEGVAVYGGDGRLKLSNPSFADLWGLNPEDVEGEPHINTLVGKMENLFDEDQWEDNKTLLISHGIDRKVQEGRVARTNETLLEYTTVPLPDGGVLVSYFDVTSSVQVENALREKNAALEAAEELKTDFLANVSYQLRTPLNAIMGFAEILDHQYFGELNDKQKEYSSGIQDAGKKLVRLIDDILDLSTIEAGYLDLSMNEFDIRATLDTLYDLTKEWALKERIDVSLDCPDDIGTIIADERRIKQVMLNLIHNAINFTPEKGKIIIGALKDDEYLHLSVTDTGIGISESDMKRVFEPFERAVIEHRADMSATALSRGAGLGLSLVKNIVEMHGGQVAIDSEEDKGTKVTMSLPLEPLLEPLL